MANATPDFDNMTPQQISEWMESLARRQGATEGFTTSASADIPEIDPSTVDASLLEDTYIPFGWTKEQWEAQLAKEAAEKAAKQATQAAPVPPPSPAPAAPVPPPAATPAAAGKVMTEEEITEFMLSLPLDKQLELLTEMGKKQRGEPNRVAELLPTWDESSVDQSKVSKYVPYGWKEEDWDAYLAKEEAAKQAGQTVSPLPPPPPTPVPAPQPEAELPDVLKAPSLDDLFSNQTSYNEEELELLDTRANAPQAVSNPLDWLSSLGGGDAAPVDLGDLSQGLDIPAAPSAEDPMAWLATLAGPETPAAPELDLNAISGDLFGIGGADDAPAAPVDDDRLNWLETLAKSQGAATQELITPANATIDRSTLSQPTDDGPGYQPYSFEEGSSGEQLNLADLDTVFSSVGQASDNDFDDPESWLDNLAAGVNVHREETPTLEEAEPDTVVAAQAASAPEEDPMEVMRKLNAGAEVSPEAMENFFEAMFERAAQEPDEPEAFAADEIPPIQAEIPDWLQESFASVANEPELNDVPVAQMLEDLGLSDAPAEALPLVDDPLSAPTSLDWMQELPTTDISDEQMLDEIGFEFTESVDEEGAEAIAIPDWLLDAEPMAEDMSDIFADANTIPPDLVAPPPQFVVDANDPWVQALTQEAEGESQLRQWYEQSVARLDAPTPATTVAQMAPVGAAESLGGLQRAELPDDDSLTPGEPVEVPAWLLGMEAPAPVPAAPAPAPTPAVLDTDTYEGIDWLESAPVDNDIPDWLIAQVDDTAAPADDLPDWLAGADISSEDIPDWLRETVEDEAENTLPAPAPAAVVPAAPPPALVPAPAAPRSPAPVPTAARIDVAATLQSARSRAATDVDASLRDYEAVVRANAALPEVVQDLNKLANDKTHKANPAVHRVLGDALMRQGNLKDALATYRKALNLL
jgi:hypothetical protein